MPDMYSPMQTRAAPFNGTANLASLCAVIAALWFGFQIIFSILYSFWFSGTALSAPLLDENAFFLGSTPAAVCVNLALFWVYTIILWAMMRMIHGLDLTALIGPARRALDEFAKVSLYLLPIYGLLVIPALFLPDAQQQYALTTWLQLLPATLPLLFVQISAEELGFRGYLQGHFAALTSNPIIWIGVPSLLFGLIHYNPVSPTYTAWAYVIWAAALGVVCADLTARSGTLGPALAVHFINNIGALIILAADDWLYGVALFVWPTNGEPWVPWIPYEALFLFTIWLAGRIALRR